MFLIILLFLFLACSGGGDGGPTYAARDSAGIRIVENSSPTWTEREAWQVDPNPAFDVSGQDDDELFRVSSPRVLPGGRIVLFNGGNCEVRFYDDTGESLGSSGRCGNGPGEFGQYAGIWPWRGDSLLIATSPLRITILDGGGFLGRTVRLPSSSNMPFPVVRGALEDGTLVLSGLINPAGRGSPGIETAQYSLGLIRNLRDTIRLMGIYPGPMFVYTEVQGRLGRGALPFSSATKFTIDDQWIFVGFPDRFEIQVWASDGTLQRIIRRAFQPVQVTQDDIDRLMERRLAEIEGAESKHLVRQAFRDLQHADVMPAFGVPTWIGRAEGGPDMLADAAGNLWVFENYRPGEYRNHFTVFSPDGVWLGSVAVPEHFTPSQIGTDFLIGTWTDEMGFVHVRRHRLIRP